VDPDLRAQPFGFGLQPEQIGSNFAHAAPR
jgi:hypothetical protein